MYVSKDASDWNSFAPRDFGDLEYRVYLVGDAGDPSGAESTLALLRNVLDKHSTQDGAVILLGDNAYEVGLPDSGITGRADAEKALRLQLDAIRDYPGKIFFIPGNHDWNDSRKGGRAAVSRQERFIESYLNRGDIFLPTNGFPGPIDIELTDRIKLLALDTEWWFSEDRPFGDTGAYDLREASDFVLEANRLLTKYRNDDVLIVGHHPLFANGDHGGHFPLASHLSPFPILGTLRILYRQFVGGSQDFANARYRLLRRELQNIFGSWDGDHLIYAGGHDHSLQYFEVHNRLKTQHHIVSGSGSSTDYVSRGRNAMFTASTKGFATIDYYSDHSIWLEFRGVSRTDDQGQVLFRRQLRAPFVVADDIDIDAPGPERQPDTDYRDSTIMAAAGKHYRDRGFLQKLFLGSHHRKLWSADVEAPLFNPLRDEGGLTAVSEGGQSQSTTIRFRSVSGRFFTLRSIDKVAGRVWPQDLQETFARDLVQDQFAMQNPYGAFLVSRLAAAAGIYHTNPRLVYVPDDFQFNGASASLAGELALFEERPDGDMSDAASMGNAHDIISTVKMLSEITDDNDHRVDPIWWIRTRLFDMLVADWDRSRPNFRWATFEPYELDPTLTGDARTQGKIYRPVPRDRDLAMTRINGLFPMLYKTFFERAWQDFDHSYGYVKGLNKKGSPEDRRFAASLSRQDWIDAAESIVASLPDHVLLSAVNTWPPSIVEIEGDRTFEILKARRDQLPEIASRYYDLISRVVDVVGSNKHERFEIHRLNNSETEIVIFKINKDGDRRHELFRRTFLSGETDEIRLFGLDGNDQFLVTGFAVSGIRVRAVGGPGSDTFTDTSTLPADLSHTIFYDNVTGNHFSPGPTTKIIRSEDPAMNAYDPDEFHFDKTAPLLFFGSNKDDGLFVGGGAAFTVHGFRKAPYAARHKLAANFASSIKAFNVVYSGHYVGFAGPWDMILDTEILFPNNIRNFYGLGNETSSEDRDSKYYQARLKQVSLQPALHRELAEGATIEVAPHLSYTAVREDPDRFLSQPQSGVATNTFKDQIFGGVALTFDLKNLDNTLNPRHGFRWTVTADFNKGMRNSNDNYGRYSTDLALFVSASIEPQITFAGRVGGAHNLGRFPFFRSSSLGEKRNLRGFRSTRFAGRSAFYTNLDFRMQLFDFAGYLAFGDVGILAFFDRGRVWADDEESSVWHAGYGGGLWTELFRTVVLNGTFGFSDDDQTFSLRFGFQF